MVAIAIHVQRIVCPGKVIPSNLNGAITDIHEIEFWG
jgi:hypothetical protein